MITGMDGAELQDVHALSVHNFCLASKTSEHHWPE